MCNAYSVLTLVSIVKMQNAAPSSRTECYVRTWDTVELQVQLEGESMDFTKCGNYVFEFR